MLMKPAHGTFNAPNTNVSTTANLTQALSVVKKTRGNRRFGKAGGLAISVNKGEK
jgi:hypothetical protein